jgi:hypothetical protein
VQILVLTPEGWVGDGVDDEDQIPGGVASALVRHLVTTHETG